MPDLVLFTGAYLAFAIVIIGTLLFGENLAFRGTPVSWLHWLLTSGIWSGVEGLVLRVCGEGGAQRLEALLVCCCDRPNPLLQVTYLVFLTSGYALYCVNIFSLLPNAWAGDHHIVSGTAWLLVAALTWLAACRSDPGTVTLSSLQAHTALYPCDGVLWEEKWCVSCGLARPARSKHCRVCNRCIARHDHHCGWINNCVGLANLRLFWLFLAMHLGLCLYGAGLGVWALLGAADAAGVLRHQVLDYLSGRPKHLYLAPSRLLHWLVVFHPLAVAVTMFCVLASLLLLGFLAYHTALLLQGRTQYEAYRWRQLYQQLHTSATAKAGEGAGGRSNPEGVAAAAAGGAAAAAAAAVESATSQAASGEVPGSQGSAAGQAGGSSGGPSGASVQGAATGQQPAGQVPGRGSAKGQASMRACANQPGCPQPNPTAPGREAQHADEQSAARRHVANWPGGWLRAVTDAWGRRGPVVAVQLPSNPYNRGLRTNLSEVLWPEWHLRDAWTRQRKARRRGSAVKAH
ncbi:DHHC palmitoyltransferase-domain-containing protein [Haematococcus lacustris]